MRRWGSWRRQGRATPGSKGETGSSCPFPVACGHCFFCGHGEFSQCDNSNDYGEAGGLFGYSKSYGNCPGGQAEYLRVPCANVGPVVVPEGLTDEQVLFLTDILPTSRWGAEIGGVKQGDTVVVLGCGPVGLLTVKWAIFLGAKRVIAVDSVGTGWSARGGTASRS